MNKGLLLLCLMTSVSTPAYSAQKNFGPSAFLSTFTPVQVVLGNFRGTGHLDAVVSDDGTGNNDGIVAIQAGNGDGTFGPPTTVYSGGSPSSLVTADLNGDGIPDLVIGDSVAAKIQILIGNGDGTFRVGETIAAGPAYRLRMVDFNGDGIPDIAVIPNISGSVVLIPGNGDGTFGAALTIAVTGDITDIAVGDINGDHLPDLALADYKNESVQILTAISAGQYHAPVSIPAKHYLTTITFTRNPGTGFLDIIAGSQQDPGVNGLLQIYTSKGDGTFSAPTTYATRSPPWDILTADLNGDGSPDIATVNPADDSVSVLLGKGDGTYAQSAVYRVGLTPSAIAVADVNGDGKPDVVTADADDSAITVLLNQNAGAFRGDTEYEINTPWISAPVDINGDGYPDEVAIYQTTNAGQTCVTAQAYLNDTHGTLVPGTKSSLGCNLLGGNLVVADMNGDGKPDIVFDATDVGQGIGISYGNGDGSFGVARTYIDSDLTVSYSKIFIGDLNRDGRPDIVVDTHDDLGQRVDFFLQQIDGSFTRSPTLRLSGNYNVAALADMNQDGYLDLILSGYSSSIFQPSVQIMLGGANVTFGSPSSYSVPGYDVVVADIDKDGWPDIVVESSSGISTMFQDGFAVMHNNRDGTLAAYVTYPMINACLNPFVADLNGDGYPDVGCYAVQPGLDSTLLAINYNNGDGTFAHPNFYPGLEVPAQLYAADMNGDGLPDVVADMHFFNQNPTILRGDAPLPFALGVFFQGPALGTLPPRVMNDVIYAPIGIPELVPLSGVDETGAPLLYQIKSGPVNGTVTLDATGTNLIYTPGSGSIPPGDVITLQATSTNGTSNVSEIEIAETEMSIGAEAGNVTVTEGGSYNGTLPFIYPTDMNPLIPSIVLEPLHGTIQITDPQTSAYTYTADAGYNGPDSFVFKLCDQYILCNSNTVSIVDGNPLPVVANPVTMDMVCGTTVHVQLPGISPDGDVLTYSISHISQGSISSFDRAQGTLEYSSACNFIGKTSFSYQVTNGITTANSTVTISITQAQSSGGGGSTGSGSSGSSGNNGSSGSSGNTGGSTSTGGGGSGGATSQGKSGGGGVNIVVLLLLFAVEVFKAAFARREFIEKNALEVANLDV